MEQPTDSTTMGTTTNRDELEAGDVVRANGQLVRVTEWREHGFSTKCFAERLIDGSELKIGEATTLTTVAPAVAGKTEFGEDNFGGSVEFSRLHEDDDGELFVRVESPYEAKETIKSIDAPRSWNSTASMWEVHIDGVRECIEACAEEFFVKVSNDVLAAANRAAEEA